MGIQVGPALRRLGAGVLVGLAAAMPHIRSGRLKALAVTSAVRSTALPDVPLTAGNAFIDAATDKAGLGAIDGLEPFRPVMIGIDAGNFWSIQQNGVDVWRDVGNGVVKSAVFGVICTAVALYQGYETEATPEGVAYATTRTVVTASLGVLAMDFILTALMFSTP